MYTIGWSSKEAEDTRESRVGDSSSMESRLRGAAESLSRAHQRLRSPRFAWSAAPLHEGVIKIRSPTAGSSSGIS